MIVRYATLLSLVVLTGCGYHLAGEQRGLPADIHSLRVGSVVNHSQEYGLEKTLAFAFERALPREFDNPVSTRTEPALEMVGLGLPLRKAHAGADEHVAEHKAGGSRVVNDAPLPLKATAAKIRLIASDFPRLRSAAL